MEKEDIIERLNEIEAYLMDEYINNAKTALYILRNEIRDSLKSSITLDSKAEEMQRNIIVSKEPLAAYFFARDVSGADIDALQQVVIKHGKSQDMYNFAIDVKGADIHALQKGIIATDSGWIAYHFAMNVKGADTQALQEVVLRSHDTDLVFNFAKNVDGADIHALQQIIMDHGNGWSLYDFAKYVDGANLLRIEARLKELCSQDFYHDYIDRFNDDTVIQKRLKEQKKNDVTNNVTARPKRM